MKYRVNNCCCYFLSHVSSSEANDLALRICEHVTGGTEVLVLDGAYHGHTQPLMGLSSYKARQQRSPVITRNTKAWVVSTWQQSSQSYQIPALSYSNKHSFVSVPSSVSSFSIVKFLYHQVSVSPGVSVIRCQCHRVSVSSGVSVTGC